VNQQMQTKGVNRGSHCRRKTRPAIAKRYDIDGGCMREYYRMKTTCLRDYTTSINQSLINQSLINQSLINQSINQSISHQSISHQSISHQSISHQSINQSINLSSINLCPCVGLHTDRKRVNQTIAKDRYVIHFQLADEIPRRYMVRSITNLSEC